MKYSAFIPTIVFLVIFSLFQYYDIPDVGYARLWTMTHMFASLIITVIVCVPFAAYSAGVEDGKKNKAENKVDS